MANQNQSAEQPKPPVEREYAKADSVQFQAYLIQKNRKKRNI